MKIMVVDDDKTTRKILGLYLKGKGHEPVFAENGVDAIEKLASNEVDIIMTDLNMPYMDGIELTKTLKNDPSFQSIPILMLSTENDDEEKKKAADAGINAYMVKPVSSESVDTMIKQMLLIKKQQEGK
ncbi:MAG: response regulator [Nitrospirota bacterium]|uniref:Chemotaxis protein CheY n=1 Tax=Candidatus Magnetominusculus xianensis TaxID=1748249 RepID=A0ABR5SE63_9BACT|nr:response regulator [Candidatus Magnetominusculus xianensis]KWT84080.1 chemotaxis protein CheY [Candidatus Magnetominusculus xianensis]MBF0402373.1 response regulator [Nitrospirota bacterium]